MVFTKKNNPARKTTPTSFWARVEKRGDDQCWPWTGARSKEGYGIVGYSSKFWLAHRLAYFLMTGRKPEAVCHHCDNQPCCNPKHLFEGDRALNNADRHAKGRSRGASHPGIRNPMARLTEDQVREVFTSRLPPREIGPQFSLSVSQVCDIRSRRIWKSATEGLERGCRVWRTENANARAAERVR